VIDLRKLAAIDIAFLGYRLILAEYAFGVLFSLALGILILARGHSGWQFLLGAYFVCLGINYVPMLAWTISFGSPDNARAEIEPEIADRSAAMAKFRRASLALLVPLLPVGLIVAQRLRKSGKAAGSR
jgi:hypothetical protein